MNSYWLEERETKKQVQCDVCIVGGGISGLSVAYWLQKEDPSLKIVLLEKALLGSGATGRNAGFMTCGSVEHFNRMVGKHGKEQALEIWRFAEENLKLLKEEVIGQNHNSISFKQNGAFSLAASANELKELEEVANMMSAEKIPVESLNATAVENRLGAVDFSGGVKYLNDGEVDPIALLKLIQSRVDCEFFENAPVDQITTEGSECVLGTPAFNVKASMVVLTLNGYSAALEPYFVDKIFPTRGQIMMLEPVKLFMEGPCYANFYLDYFRQLNDGSLLIGGFRQLEADTEKGFSDHTTEIIQQALHDFTERHLPQFKNSPVSHRWAGVMGFSVDGEPMIGSLPSDPQVFFSGGFTGHGLGLAFHTAKKLVDLMFGRPVPHWLSARRLSS